MINAIGKFLNSALPASIAVGGLGKIDPRFKKFFYSAGLAGYGADAALDYLRNQFEGEGQKQETNRLQERQESGNARPDELQALRTGEQNQSLPNAIQKGVSVGAGLAGGLAGLGVNAAGAAAEQIQPENPQQPSPQEIQPPSALSGAAMEEDVQAQNAQPQAQNDQQNDFSEILKHIRNRVAHGGRSLEQAAQEIAGTRQFKHTIRHIEQQSGMVFIDWLRNELAGTSQSQNPQQVQAQQGQGSSIQLGQGQSGAGKKDQILQGMNSLTQAIQGFKR